MTRALSVAALLTATVLSGWAGTGVASAQTACADLGGALNAEQSCQVHSSTPTYTVDFSFPAGYPDEQAVSAYLTQTRDGFANVSEMPGSRGLPYVLDAKGTAYHSGLAPRGTQSLVLEVYQNVGGAHPQTWFKAFTYDLGTRAPITFDTLFRPGTRPVDLVFPAVQRDLQNKTGVDQPVLPGDGLDPQRYQNFAVTDDAVIFFFGQGELLPEAAGATQATVPRAVLAPILAI
ncbi:esterase [Mycolicibacterium baixiangningiae]|uniref:esterase n=1 Tax=Mycolicibacterium baixiangningiae TaxID=2761578 RepID=UPI0018D16840|nr:esterase [Mycolicibacterium baixiangningiae]